MQQIKLKTIRLDELIGLIDQVSIKDIGTLKDIRLVSNLSEDLRQQLKGYIELAEKFKVEREKVSKKVLKQYSKEIAEVQGDMEAAQKLEKILSAEVNQRLEKIETAKKIFEQIQKQAEEEVSFELGNDKLEKLRELFNKFFVQKYLNTKVLLEVADALGIE